jgi:hypothetical protein
MAWIDPEAEVGIDEVGAAGDEREINFFESLNRDEAALVEERGRADRERVEEESGEKGSEEDEKVALEFSGGGWLVHS